MLLPDTKISIGQRLDADFFRRSDVVQVAQDLLGKILVSTYNGVRTAGRITEVEAYRAPEDRACHAYGNRRTPRTEVMFWGGGHAYIYLCYGIHHLFNVVTGPEGEAHAVLIRAVEPVEGLDTMLARRNRPTHTRGAKLIPVTTGPGAVGQAMGFHANASGQNMLLDSTPVWIETDPHQLAPPPVRAGTRIGVESSGECALWPWRFWIEGTKYVLRPT